MVDVVAFRPRISLELDIKKVQFTSAISRFCHDSSRLTCFLMNVEVVISKQFSSNRATTGLSRICCVSQYQVIAGQICLERTNVVTFLTSHLFERINPQAEERKVVEWRKLENNQSLSVV